jgi:hypothetical protein
MKTLAFNRQTLVACTLALCAAPLWAQSTAPANASTTQVPAETTAQCQARITAEYDAKIAKAQAEGEAGAKKVALFTRKKAEFVESCGALDRIAAADQRIAAADQRIAANRAEIAAADQRIAASEFWTANLNSVRGIMDKVIAGQTTLSPQDLGKLSHIRAQTQSRTDGPTSQQAIEGSIALIEARTGQKIPAAPLGATR